MSPPKRAVKLLGRYSPSEELISGEDLSWLKGLGLAFDKQWLHHDEAVERAMLAFGKITKVSVSGSFIAGIHLNRADLCAALASYAVMINFPGHKFSPLLDRGLGIDQCKICGVFRYIEFDGTFANRCRWGGYVSATDPRMHMFNLEAHLEGEDVIDVHGRKATNVFEIISKMHSGAKPNDLVKAVKLSGVTEFSLGQIRNIVGILGYAGILQTDVHKGWVEKFHGYNVPRSSRSSDWPYPVDFWRGSDGLNADAVKFWFCGFKEITGWVDSNGTL